MHDRSKRWANPSEFDYWAKVYSTRELARRLRRTQRTIRDWLSGKRPIPAWAIEVLRLHELEAEAYRQRLYYPLHKRRQLDLAFHDAKNESQEATDQPSTGTGGVAR